jgi:hypothetical protein
MPSRYRLTVALTFKQFLSAILLRIFPIQNFEPSAVLSLRDIRRVPVLRYNPLQIQFETRCIESRPVGRVGEAHRAPDCSIGLMPISDW